MPMCLSAILDWSIFGIAEILRNSCWVCRYLPDDNRSMMISRSSARSGFIYMINV